MEVLEILKLNRRGFERSSNSGSRKGDFDSSLNSVIVEEDFDSQIQYSVEDEILRDFSNSVE